MVGIAPFRLAKGGVALAKWQLKSYLYCVNRILVMYVTTAGKKVFQDWLDSLDESTSARVAARLDRIEQGNFGDCKPAREGVYELRLDFGPGYRVYFGIVSGQVVLLTCGGTKKTQTKDIESAIEYLKEYKKRHI